MPLKENHLSSLEDITLNEYHRILRKIYQYFISSNSIKIFKIEDKIIKCGWRVSIPLPQEPQSYALPIELHPLHEMYEANYLQQKQMFISEENQAILLIQSQFSENKSKNKLLLQKNWMGKNIYYKYLQNIQFSQKQISTLINLSVDGGFRSLYLKSHNLTLFRLSYIHFMKYMKPLFMWMEGFDPSTSRATILRSSD
ncbi:hypothetical protein TTHERM_00106720 (macronuclear) [Tetrahymena thermophila SB210]|uniref:Uncharacterized protein n=1 Tax=Tetrahymena thermophila (strain SB210) TaxID=312017 RepID=Q234C6_TETTS|nr:hypothetical protein TTHERM_00106720 [Tetrahymena thermophila SB210]EAR92077.1 hypothetical protein TTHERM_00106720 [Tetrahymena thermophila SB210]|eukprot:XP_001012322.1 hypothetical protein TTHERM_00106720 [Tetrahymena thermophila SB210]